MGYKKGPVGHMKASAGNKAVGYMAEGSSAYMSALYQIDPKDGVVVTAKDKSMPASEARAKRLAERNKELALKKEKRAIARENLKEEVRFKHEERKAAGAARKQRAEQKKKKAQGQIPEDAQDTSTNYMRGPLNQLDPKDGGGSKKELSPGADVDGFGNPVIKNDYLTERNTRFAAPGPAAQPNNGRVQNTLYPTSGTPKKTASGKTAVREYTFPSTGSLNASGYTQYGNNSTRSTFNDAFRQARESGAKTFQYGKSDYKDGQIRTYSTKLKGEK